jgi:beta-alanine--pyruvate transaminase
MAGSTGVLLPPRGYLRRLREICDKHGILLIFDEVISGFGRLGAAFAMDKFAVVPDMVVVAKGITNGTVPMGAVFASDKVHDAFMTGPEGAIELFHGYTYSGHPLATAAALATLDLYRDEDLFARVGSLAPYWEDALHSLKGLPHVVDLRNIGLMGAIEIAPMPGQPGERAFQAFLACYEKGVLVRQSGDTLAMSPPFIVEKSQIDEIFTVLAEVLRRLN